MVKVRKGLTSESKVEFDLATLSTQLNALPAKFELASLLKDFAEQDRVIQ